MATAVRVRAEKLMTEINLLKRLPTLYRVIVFLGANTVIFTCVAIFLLLFSFAKTETVAHIYFRLNFKHDVTGSYYPISFYYYLGVKIWGRGHRFTEAKWLSEPIRNCH